LPLGAVACSVAEQGDGWNDDVSISVNKYDTGGILEGTPDALAVLRVANELSERELVAKVGLATNAAQAIIAVREGDDGVAGSGDDARFATLQQLDDVPFIGPSAFMLLLQYAIATVDEYGDSQATATDLGIIDGDNSLEQRSFSGHLATEGDQDWFLVHLSPHDAPGDPRPGLVYMDVWLDGPPGHHYQLETIKDVSDRRGNQFTDVATQDQNAASSQRFLFRSLVFGYGQATAYFHVTQTVPGESETALPYHVWMFLHH
jgi:hypothetical protein